MIADEDGEGWGESLKVLSSLSNNMILVGREEAELIWYLSLFLLFSIVKIGLQQFS
jgi:hypothetical protein